jgi:hypothetical protein
MKPPPYYYYYYYYGTVQYFMFMGETWGDNQLYRGVSVELLLTGLQNSSNSLHEN